MSEESDRAILPFSGGWRREREREKTDRLDALCRKFPSELLAYHHPPGGAGRALSDRTADFGAETPAIAETEITAKFDTERVAKPLIALDTISEARQTGIVERLAAAVAEFVTPFDPDAASTPRSRPRRACRGCLQAR